MRKQKLFTQKTLNHWPELELIGHSKKTGQKEPDKAEQLKGSPRQTIIKRVPKDGAAELA